MITGRTYKSVAVIIQFVLRFQLVTMIAITSAQQQTAPFNNHRIRGWHPFTFDGFGIIHNWTRRLFFKTVSHIEILYKTTTARTPQTTVIFWNDCQIGLAANSEKYKKNV